MKTIKSQIPTELDIQNSDYSYQIELTTKLDNLGSDFTQEIINEIILWKVNRYSLVKEDTLSLINKIEKNGQELDHELTTATLLKLLSKQQKGIRLAVASTILRFKNPKIYQIIDQRVYRFLYGKGLKYSESDIDQQVIIYLDYLIELRRVCNEHNINFELADRIFYTMDKKYNGDIKLNGYS